MKKINTNNKWIATVASILIQCSCGASYAFGIYSPLLKSTQGYDQSTLDTVSVFKDIGANAGVLSGLLYSVVAVNHSRASVLRGPWVVHLVGAIQCFVGYFFVWLAVTGVIQRPHVPVMCFFMFVGAHAQTFFNTANVVTAVQNFPQYGGTIVGIMKGFLGLSGAILIQVYMALFKGKPSTFLLMLALLPTLLSLLLMCFVRTDDGINSEDDKKHLNHFSVISLMVAAYLTILILLENTVTLPSYSHILAFTVLLLLLSSPLGIAIKAQREEKHPWKLSKTFTIDKSPLIDHDPESVESNKFSAVEDTAQYHELAISEEHKMQQGGKEMNIFQAMCTLNFWLLFISMVCGMGSGLATINNISQIGESLNYTTVEINTLVSLWSIWNYLGRFGAGYVSDIFLHRRGWARPIFMVVTLAAMTIGHIVVASGFPGNLYVGSVLVGICYGSQWSLMPTITSEVFGVMHMGTIFNTIAIASPVGSYIFSVRVIGYIYDKEGSGSGNSCNGTQCFMPSFLVMASVSFFGFLVALILFFRTRSFYTQVLLRRLQHSARH